MDHTIPDIALLRGVPAEDRHALAASLGTTTRTHTAGTTIVERGTAMEALMLLVSGRARAEIVTGEGQTLVVENFRGPEAIATALLFAPRPHFPVSVVAETDCTVQWLARETLLALAQRVRPVLEALLLDAGRRTAFLAARLRLVQFASLRQRIAVYLIEAGTRRADDGGEYVHLTHSRQELADMFGVARPSLSRELGHMDDEGLIRIDGPAIRIVDRAAVEALVHGCD